MPRPDPDLVLIARTDALHSTSAHDAAERGRRYIEAGADMVMIAGLPADLVSRMRAEIAAPIATFAVGLNAVERACYRDEGLDLILHPRATGMPAFQAAWDALAALRTDGTLGPYSQDSHREHYRNALEAERWTVNRRGSRRSRTRRGSGGSPEHVAYRLDRRPTR